MDMEKVCGTSSHASAKEASTGSTGGTLRCGAVRCGAARRCGVCRCGLCREWRNRSEHSERTGPHRYCSMQFSRVGSSKKKRDASRLNSRPRERGRGGEVAGISVMYVVQRASEMPARHSGARPLPLCTLHCPHSVLRPARPPIPTCFDGPMVRWSADWTRLLSPSLVLLAPVPRPRCFTHGLLPHLPSRLRWKQHADVFGATDEHHSCLRRW